MAVRTRRNGRWFFRTVIRLPDGSRCRIFGVPGEFGLPNTKTAAKEAEQRKVRMVLMGWDPRPESDKGPPRTGTVNAFAPVFVEHSEAANKFSSVQSKKQILKTHILPMLGHYDLTEVTYAVVEDFKHALLKEPKNLSPKTVNNILTVLRRMLSVAVKRGLLVAAPPVEWLRIDQDEVDFLTFDEAAALELALVDQIGVMILTGLRTGMRQGELLGLRWGDVDMPGRRVIVRHSIVLGQKTTTKSRRWREVPMTVDLMAALEAHRHDRGSFVFCDPAGKPLTKGACKWPLWNTVAAAGLRRIGWHALRHTFASHLVMRGVPLKHVQELLGHSTIQMTMRYAHLAPEVKQDAIKVLDRGATVGATTSGGGKGNGGTGGDSGGGKPS